MVNKLAAVPGNSVGNGTIKKTPEYKISTRVLYLSTAARSSKLLVRRCTAVVEGAFSRTNG